MNDETKLSIKEYTLTVVSVDMKDLPWKYVLESMLFYALEPIILPVMHLLSKILKRSIKFLPFKIKEKDE